MDEREVPEDSSEEISTNKSPAGDDIVPPSSGVEPPRSDADEKQEELGANNSADAAEIGISITPEELPTMQWSDVYSELAEFELPSDEDTKQDSLPSADQEPPAQTGPLEGLKEAMDWLEELAAGQGIPIDEMPTLVTDQPVIDASTKKTGGSKPPSKGDPATQALELDSDPMAWLEQLAVDQSSPLEELPSVADRLLASEIISQDDIPPGSSINDPYDVNRALTYLEQLAVAQGIDLSKVSFDANQPVNSLNSALAIIDGLVLTGMAVKPDASEADAFVKEQGAISSISEEEAPDGLPELDHWSDVSAGMPGDPQQALDWLSSMDEEQDAAELEVVEEVDTIAPEVDSPEQDASINLEDLEQGKDEAQIDVDVLGEMPEDPDEAVAWMEHLAARDSQEPAAETEKPPLTQSESATPAPEAQVNALAEPGEDDLEKAILTYKKIIEEGAVTEDVVAALEEIIESHGETPKILRLLGDAYMQIGETEKAIATYRKGFDHL